MRLIPTSACRHLSQARAQTGDASEVVSGGLFVAGCDGTKVLDDVDDEIALAREREVALTWRLAICPGWNDGSTVPVYEKTSDLTFLTLIGGTLTQCDPC